MPPKDTILSNGSCEISFAPLANLTEAHHLEEVIADCLSVFEADEADDAPTASIPAPATGKYEFPVASAPIVRETIRKLLGCDIDRKDDTFSVILQMGKEYIRRPHNLKYPNKKRAKRILNKWRNRFGVSCENLIIPKCAIIDVDTQDGFCNLKLVAKQ